MYFDVLLMLPAPNIHPMTVLVVDSVSLYSLHIEMFWIRVIGKGTIKPAKMMFLRHVEVLAECG